MWHWYLAESNKLVEYGGIIIDSVQKPSKVPLWYLPRTPNAYSKQLTLCKTPHRNAAQKTISNLVMDFSTRRCSLR